MLTQLCCGLILLDSFTAASSLTTHFPTNVSFKTNPSPEPAEPKATKPKKVSDINIFTLSFTLRCNFIVFYDIRKCELNIDGKNWLILNY